MSVSWCGEKIFKHIFKRFCFRAWVSLKRNSRGAFLELEESGMEYDTFSACYTFPKHKNTYSKFFAFFSQNGYPWLTRDLDFRSGVLPPRKLSENFFEGNWLPLTNSWFGFPFGCIAPWFFILNLQG